MAFITEAFPRRNRPPAKPAAPNGKALQKKLSRHNVFPVRKALFSFQPVTPHRIGPRRVLHLPSPNPKQNARRTQATGVVLPPKEGDIPLAAFAEGECLRGGKMRHPGWGQDAAIWG